MAEYFYHETTGEQQGYAYRKLLTDSDCIPEGHMHALSKEIHGTYYCNKDCNSN